ncbi:MAG: hypothetical protein JNM80_13640 [Phycisphaerae bacterium]|nr:hypothetical protein [Phycisphaerae bacterium]
MSHVEVKVGGTTVANGRVAPTVTGSAGLRGTAEPPPDSLGKVIADLWARRRVFGAMTLGPLATIVWLYVFTLGLTINSEPFRRRLENMGGQPAATVPAQASPAAPALTLSWLRRGLESALASEPAKAEARVAAASVGAPMGLFTAAGLGLLVTVTFTPTNVAILCCLAALVGCFGRIATSTGGSAGVHGSALPGPAVGSDGGAAAGGDDTSAAEGSEGTASAGASTPVEREGPRDARVHDDLASGTLAPAVAAVMWGFFIYLSAISGLVAITGDPFSSTTPGQYLRLAGAVSLLAFVVGWRPHLLMQLVSQVGPSKFGKVG